MTSHDQSDHDGAGGKDICTSASRSGSQSREQAISMIDAY